MATAPRTEAEPPVPCALIVLDGLGDRPNPATGNRDQIPIRLKEIQNRKADDVAMKSNDILYVPDSTGKKALARSAQAMFGIGTQVAVYRVP